MEVEESMKAEVGSDVRFNEVRSGFTPPRLNGVCGVSEKQDQGTSR